MFNKYMQSAFHFYTLAREKLFSHCLFQGISNECVLIEPCNRILRHLTAQCVPIHATKRRDVYDGRNSTLWRGPEGVLAFQGPVIIYGILGTEST
jgi:hypothetical protein